ncbi:hypothetical protein QBC44DRAFT_313722 [Cladorrhinum sp. PSN332]|nr:hypothetical protein QBC44DRAFT_313722 [Cladorrhinum sp. PSN332]
MVRHLKSIHKVKNQELSDGRDYQTGDIVSPGHDADSDSTEFQDLDDTDSLDLDEDLNEDLNDTGFPDWTEYLNNNEYEDLKDIESSLPSPVNNDEVGPQVEYIQEPINSDEIALGNAIVAVGYAIDIDHMGLNFESEDKKHPQTEQLISFQRALSDYCASPTFLRRYEGDPCKFVIREEEAHCGSWWPKLHHLLPSTPPYTTE